MPAKKITHSFRNECLRKAIHLSSFWIPLMIWNFPKITAAGVLLILAAADFFIEYMSYRRAGNVNNLVRKNMLKTMRLDELRHDIFVISGAFYVLVGAFCCTLVFDRMIACAAVCVLIAADAVAALVGKFCGKFIIFEGKTLEGTLAFFICALLVTVMFAPSIPLVHAGFIAAAAATVAELYAPKLKVDDNFLIPLVFGYMCTTLIT